MLATSTSRLHVAEHAIFCQLHFSGRVSPGRQTLPHLSIPFRKGWVSRLARCSLPHPRHRRFYLSQDPRPTLYLGRVAPGRMGHRWYCHMADTREARPRRRQNRDCNIRTNPRQTRRAALPNYLIDVTRASSLLERHIYIYFFTTIPEFSEFYFRERRKDDVR